MAWSTRELAELAGTTVKAVRHYHQVGVLDEPEREPNGYKQYRTSHLVRLLQVTRLRALGIPLKEIRAAVHPEEALRAVHDELGATIERLQRMRAEMAVILEHRVPLDTPSAFGAVSGDLGPRDRALLTVFSRVWEDESLGDLSALAAESREYEAEFEVLPEDADEGTIEALAVRVAAAVREDHARFPWLRDPGSRSPRGKRTADTVVAQAFAENYHAAQIRVLARASELVGRRAAP
ncbi:MerR family transcriptional regulator [Pseudonocardia endophytica]|uniref:DNA-binding transcriptional MerR regulator n=1 Tax=Pseudonocardia endophytica TaxID=401976 RepID=A0A4R1I2F8_PSEEN|nr:MerR family transcriptional regulator [Pseudonocardia endophytica]TCK26679.1 DNA-binding transcriptional MerR regulator [Pseudonocardia endophytica]